MQGAPALLWGGYQMGGTSEHGLCVALGSGTAGLGVCLELGGAATSSVSPKHIKD